MSVRFFIIYIYNHQKRWFLKSPSVLWSVCAQLNPTRRCEIYKTFEMKHLASRSVAEKVAWVFHPIILIDQTKFIWTHS